MLQSCSSLASHLLFFPLLLVLFLILVCAAIFVLHLFLLLISVLFIRGILVITIVLEIHNFI